MTLITRLTRLFHADMNAVLDQIEEPEVLLKQALREMDSLLIQEQQQIKLLELKQQQFLGKQDELKQSLSELEQQLIFCFKSEKDDLARSLIRRKLETKQQLKLLTNTLKNLNEQSQQLKIQLKEHQSQFNSMQQKADIFKQNYADQASDYQWDNTTVSIQDEDIEVAFLHEKQQWSQS